MVNVRNNAEIAESFEGMAATLFSKSDTILEGCADLRAEAVKLVVHYYFDGSRRVRY
jgi:hypothetical protein